MNQMQLLRRRKGGLLTAGVYRVTSTSARSGDQCCHLQEKAGIRILGQSIHDGCTDFVVIS